MPASPPPPAPGADDCGATVAAQLSPGTSLLVGKKQKTVCQEFTWVPEQHSLALVKVPGHSLCIVPNTTTGLDTDNIENAELVLARCPSSPGGVSASMSAFTLAHNNTINSQWNVEHKQQILHKSSGKCISGRPTGPPVLSACDPEEPSQMWVFGSSGRICQGGCLGAAVQ